MILSDSTPKLSDPKIFTPGNNKIKNKNEQTRVPVMSQALSFISFNTL